MKHESLDGATVTYPGAAYEFGRLTWRMGNPAPAYGQHTREILAQLGYSEAQIKALAEEEVIYVRD